METQKIDHEQWPPPNDPQQTAEALSANRPIIVPTDFKLVCGAPAAMSYRIEMPCGCKPVISCRPAAGKKTATSFSMVECEICPNHISVFRDSANAPTVGAAQLALHWSRLLQNGANVLAAWGTGRPAPII